MLESKSAPSGLENRLVRRSALSLQIVCGSQPRDLIRIRGWMMLRKTLAPKHLSGSLYLILQILPLRYKPIEYTLGQLMTSEAQREFYG
jgi:hypothetical protein